MIKTPKNISYKIFDLSLKGSTHRYVPKDDSLPNDAAQQNIDIIKHETNASAIVFLRQVHGDLVTYADRPSVIGDEVEADGSYTERHDLMLAIQTADCVPVLMYGADGSVIGAAHCGWKGAKLNIMKNLYDSLAKKTNDIQVIIGPSIHQKSYEVDKAFCRNFLSEDEANERFFIRSIKEEHFMFDLPAYVKAKLEQLPLISSIHHIDEDTYSARLENGGFKYPSYRRSCHTGEIYPRNLLSTIIIKK